MSISIVFFLRVDEASGCSSFLVFLFSFLLKLYCMGKNCGVWGVF